jgi:hypothetical protein
LNSVEYLIVENSIVFAFGHLERMQEGNQSSATNSNNSGYEFDREMVLSFMRDVEIIVVIIPCASIEISTEETTTQTEEEGLPTYYFSSSFSIRISVSNRRRIIWMDKEREDDYLTTFTLEDNAIVI